MQGNFEMVLNARLRKVKAHTRVFVFLTTWRMQMLMLVLHDSLSIHACIYPCIHQSILPSIHSSIHPSMHVCMHACIHTYRQTDRQTYRHTYIHTYTHTHHTHTYMHTSMVSLPKWEAVNKFVHESAVASRLKQHAIRNVRGVAR